MERLGLNSTIEHIPQKYDMLQWEQSLKKIVADIDSIRNDQLASKELE